MMIAPRQSRFLFGSASNRAMGLSYEFMPIDPSAVVAPTAVVSPDAVIGPGVRIGEFCIVEAEVVIGPHCVLDPYVYIKRWTTLGEGNEIGAGTVLGTDPLDRNFAGARSYLRIGNGNKIREHFTISRGTPPESVTEIGDGNFIMTSGHIAHNCKIGSGTVIASCVLLGGYVEIEDQAFLSGGVLVHQFSKVGRLAMVSGNTRVNLDAPPFFTYSGFAIEPRGLNLVGLKRAGYKAPQVSILKQAYRYLYRSSLKLEEALARIASEIPTPETLHLVAFVRGSQRGIARE
jgi:UDP-N-acetylglucosamine acyltransferase